MKQFGTNTIISSEMETVAQDKSVHPSALVTSKQTLYSPGASFGNSNANGTGELYMSIMVQFSETAPNDKSINCTSVLFTLGFNGVKVKEATGGSEVQMKFGMVLVPTHPFASVTDNPMSKHPLVAKVLFREAQLFPEGTPLIHHVHPLEFPAVVFRMVVVKGIQPVVLLQVNEGVGSGLMIMSCVSLPPQLPAELYVMVTGLVPAKLGSNIPVEAFVIPNPLQVPPAEAAVS